MKNNILQTSSPKFKIYAKIADQKDDLSGKLVNNRFMLINNLSQNSYSNIMLAKDRLYFEMVVIKMEKFKQKLKNNFLSMEYKSYQMIGLSTDGFPRIYYYGHYSDYNIMAMEQLGQSLQSVFDDYCRFSSKTILYLFLQLLDRIEHIHSSDLVHRDIKPQNLLLGRRGSPNENVIHLIDFSSADRYRNSESKTHIPMKKTGKLIGTLPFMSINSHLGQELSRRDDLESIGYVILYLAMQGQLPWTRLCYQQLSSINQKDYSNQLNQNKEILKLKTEISMECLSSRTPQQFRKYFEYVRKLNFSDKPDYQYLRSLFIELFKKEREDAMYEWNIKKSPTNDQIKR